MSIAERLRDELDERGWSTRHFQQRVEAAADDGARGISYAAVHGYVNGTVEEPSLSFLRTAAEVLEVNLAWLIQGDRPRTDAEADEDEVSEAALLGRRWTQELSEALEEEMGGPIPLVAHAVVAHHWRRLEVMGSYTAGRKYRGEVLVRRLAKALVGPLREFDYDEGAFTPSTLGALNEEERGDYLIGVVPAIASAIRHRLYAESLAVTSFNLESKGFPGQRTREEEDDDGQR